MLLLLKAVSELQCSYTQEACEATDMDTSEFDALLPCMSGSAADSEFGVTVPTL